MDSLKKYRSRVSCQVPSCYNNRHNKNPTQLLHSFYKIPGFKRGEAIGLKKWTLPKIIWKQQNLKIITFVIATFVQMITLLLDHIRLNVVPSFNLEYQENIPGFPSSTNLTKSHSPSVYNFNEEEIFDCSDIVSSSSFFDSDEYHY